MAARFIIIITLIGFVFCQSCAQLVKRPVRMHDEGNAIELINQKIEYCYQKGNVDSLLKFYAKTFTCSPEYKPVIEDADTLRKFFTGWFYTTHIEKYQKTIYETQRLSNYLLEIGNLKLTYSTTEKKSDNYTAKYMIMWQKHKDGGFSILSEIFGSDKNIEPEDMPYASVEISDNRTLEKNVLDKRLSPEIESFDRDMIKDILSGNGEGRAQEFAKDGIYMPHFDSMQIGMDMIRPYMLKTYNSANLAYVQNKYREIFNLGDYVFLNGHFKVGWDNAQTKGDFQGNMSNLMKRDTDGKLKMYRQLAHNDRKVIVVNK